MFESLLGSSCIHFMDHRIMIGGLVITIINTFALAVYAIAMQNALDGWMPYAMSICVAAICFVFSDLFNLIPVNIWVYIIVEAVTMCERVGPSVRHLHGVRHPDGGEAEGGGRQVRSRRLYQHLCSQDVSARRGSDV